MTPSPTDEIKAIRRKLAARLENDIQRIAEELREHEMASGRTYITLPKREPANQPGPNPYMAPAVKSAHVERG